jgi:hypothetical protein
LTTERIKAITRLLQEDESLQEILTNPRGFFMNLAVESGIPEPERAKWVDAKLLEYYEGCDGFLETITERSEASSDKTLKAIKEITEEN